MWKFSIANYNTLPEAKWDMYYLVFRQKIQDVLPRETYGL
jgi:hypothetical protein